MTNELVMTLRTPPESLDAARGDAVQIKHPSEIDMEGVPWEIRASVQSSDLEDAVYEAEGRVSLLLDTCRSVEADLRGWLEEVSGR